MVNLYNSRLKEFNIDQIIKNTHDKLTQWRDECYKTIDNFINKN